MIGKIKKAIPAHQKKKLYKKKLSRQNNKWKESIKIWNKQRKNTPVTTITERKATKYGY